MQVKFYNLPQIFEFKESVLGEIFPKLFDFHCDFDINIIFLEKEEMCKLNLQFREINKTTDVLTFGPYDDIAEIYISLDHVQETIKLIIHGILHLKGYDHEGYENTTEEMYILQEEYLNKFYDILKK